MLHCRKATLRARSDQNAPQQKSRYSITSFSATERGNIDFSGLLDWQVGLNAQL
jgi:hypothetical protein